MRALIALLVPAAAVTPTTKLELRHDGHERLEFYDHSLAQSWYDDTTITVELRANGKVAASVVGTRRSNDFRFVQGKPKSVEDATILKTTWTGTYTTRSWWPSSRSRPGIVPDGRVTIVYDRSAREHVARCEPRSKCPPRS